MKFCSRITRNWKIFVMNISRYALVKYFPQWFLNFNIYTISGEIHHFTYNEFRFELDLYFCHFSTFEAK